MNLQNTLKQTENNIRTSQGNSFVGSSKDPFTNPTRDNYQTYPYDFFSGSDAKVYLGDIYVEDIITIQYNVTQSKVPIYGYASQLFDAIAKGQVLVEGTLAINFKEVGYLNLIQAQLESQRRGFLSNGALKATIDKSLKSSAKFTPGLNYIGDNAKPDNYGAVVLSDGTPQIIRQQETIEEILLNKKSSLALANTLGVASNSDKDFEDFAEILEDTIWGDTNGKPFAAENKLKRIDEFDYSPNGGIYSSKNSPSNTLNILITFGDINDYRAEHTLISINDVHFTSSSMIVAPDGNPIAESYTFIARNINESINNKNNSIRINPVKLNVGNDNLKISTIENVEQIEQFLDKKNNIATINIIKAYAGVWGDYEGTINFNYTGSTIEPFIDTIIKQVENAINETVVPEIIDTTMIQYIIDVNFNDSDKKLTMILEQQFANTRTYKVISPTRTGYASSTIINRSDIYTIKPPQEPLQDRPKITSTDKQKKEQSIIDANKYKEKLKNDNDDIVLANLTSDERNASSIPLSLNDRKTLSSVAGQTTIEAIIDRETGTTNQSDRTKQLSLSADRALERYARGTLQELYEQRIKLLRESNSFYGAIVKKRNEEKIAEIDKSIKEIQEKYKIKDY